MKPVAALAAGMLLGACATVPKQGGFEAVQTVAQERLAQRVYWYQGGPEDVQVQERLRTLLRSELTAEGAVTVALLNNRGLQATYEELGVAQADLVQAGLLRNPRISAQLNVPVNRPDAFLSPVVSVDFDFLSIFTLPLRKSIAEDGFEAAKLRVSDQVLRLAREVRTAHANVAAAEQTAAMWRAYLEAQAAAADLSRRQREAGNISLLENTLQRDAYDSDRVQVARAEAAALEARERLVRLLGLWGKSATVRIAALAPVPEAAEHLDQLESLAIRQRLDLAAVLRERNSLAAALGVARGSQLFPLLDIGALVERDAGEGFWTVGPTLSLELPIFDQGQARVARAEALLRERERRLEELAVDIRSEVRSARNTLVAARNVVDFYRRVLIPQRRKITSESLLQYNAMQIGLFQLLVAKQNEVTANREYIESVRDYWTARADLELALGGPLPQSGGGGAPTGAAG